MYQNVMFQDQYFDLRQLSEYSCLSVRTLRSYLRQLPCFRVGGKWLVRRSEFDAFIEQKRVSNNLGKVADEILSEFGSKN